MNLMSPAFDFSEQIPMIHTGDGEDCSPALRWENAPAETKSFTLIMDDPDAPGGTWVHWVLYDLPSTQKELPQGVPKTEEGPAGSKHGVCWGVDQFERVGYFVADSVDSKPGAPVFNRTTTLRDSWAKTEKKSQ